MNLGWEVESIRLLITQAGISRNSQSVNIIHKVQTHFERKETSRFYMRFLRLPMCDTRTGVIRSLSDTYEASPSRHDIVRNYYGQRFITENHLPYVSFIDSLKSMRVVIEGESNEFVAASSVIAFKMKSQPSFNKNFPLLIEDLKNQTKAGRTNYIFTANARQVERFYAIFEDLGAQIQLRLSSNLFTKVYWYVAKVVCYTDHRFWCSSISSSSWIYKRSGTQCPNAPRLQPGDLSPIDRHWNIQAWKKNIVVSSGIWKTFLKTDSLYVRYSLHKISKFVGRMDERPEQVVLMEGNLKRKHPRSRISPELSHFSASQECTRTCFPPDGYLQSEWKPLLLWRHPINKANRMWKQTGVHTDG